MKLSFSLLAWFSDRDVGRTKNNLWLLRGINITTIFNFYFQAHFQEKDIMVELIIPDTYLVGFLSSPSVACPLFSQCISNCHLSITSSVSTWVITMTTRWRAFPSSHSEWSKQVWQKKFLQAFRIFSVFFTLWVLRKHWPPNDPLTKSLFNKISIVHDNFPSTALLVLNFAMLTRQYRVLKRDVIKN